MNQNIKRAEIRVEWQNSSPKYQNRIDKVVVFRPLSDEHLRRILDVELSTVGDWVTASQDGHPSLFCYTDQALNFLLNEVTDMNYGARQLRRAVQRLVVYPLSNLMETGQIGFGDTVNVDVAIDHNKLIFSTPRVQPVPPISAAEASAALARRRPMSA
jgi:ATP-dependent Clp protease ATP-binding subunit ClpA